MQVRDKLDMLAERNMVLHIVLRAALNGAPGWQAKAEEILMRPPNVLGETVTPDDLNIYSNEKRTCADCGGDDARWRNMTQYFSDAVFIRLCAPCYETFTKYAAGRKEARNA